MMSILQKFKSFKERTFNRGFRLPRYWSNEELSKFAGKFQGDVVNVSAWQDKDKQGRTYKNYFFNAKSYTITNYKADFRGLQGWDNEIYLDLTEDLPTRLHRRFDVVFNHTTLEHIFDVRKAFKNLCLMSRDYVIIVVPFSQPVHEVVDYWRFTEDAVSEMFKENGFGIDYISTNRHPFASKYIFAIGRKKP
jgi:hypothetical protein